MTAHPPADPHPSAARLSWATKCWYGAGKCPDVIKLRSFDLFVLFYYSQVLGLSGSLTGLAIFISLGVDAVWDPVVGVLSDSFQNARFGRRITPMVYAAIPGGLAFYCLFAPPTGLPHFALFAWMLTSAILLRTSMTFYQIPYIALQAELSDSREERSSLLVFVNIFRAATEFSLLYVAFHVFFRKTASFANGQQNPAAYPAMAAAFAVAMVLLIFGACWGLYGSAKRIRDEGRVAPGQLRALATWSLWREILIENGNLRAVILGVYVFGVMTGLNGALYIYLATYLYRLTPGEISTWGQALTIGTVVALLTMVRFIMRRFDAKPVFVIVMTIYATAEVAMAAIYLAGLWPRGIPVIYMLVTGNFIGGLAIGVATVAPALLCSIAADEHEFRTGKSQRGLIFGMIHFAQKAGAGTGGLVTGVLLDFIHFPRGAAVNAIDPGLIHDLASVYICGVVLTCGIAIAIYRSYKIRNVDHDAIIVALRQRRMVRAD